MKVLIGFLDLHMFYLGFITLRQAAWKALFSVYTNKLFYAHNLDFTGSAFINNLYILDNSGVYDHLWSF